VTSSYLGCRPKRLATLLLVWQLCPSLVFDLCSRQVAKFFFDDKKYDVIFKGGLLKSMVFLLFSFHEPINLLMQFLSMVKK
jgi:hypothetical protein